MEVVLKTTLRTFALALGLALIASPALAADAPRNKQTKLGLYLTPGEAAALVKAERAKVLFLDIRTRAEVQFVGYSEEIDAVVPLAEIGGWDEKASRFKLELNPSFRQSVEALLATKGLGKSDKIVLMCRSGDRSTVATNLLAEAGFTQVYSQIEGFEGDVSPDGKRTVNGWKNAGLPWSYRLDKAKIVFTKN
jgi:rhodanese-related sulfurtransferase